MAEAPRPGAGTSHLPSAVIDASALLELVVPTNRGSRVAEAIRPHEVVAPAHIDAEVMGALARIVRAGELTDEEATAAVERLQAAPIQRWPINRHVTRAWALRHNLRVADAFYIALARTWQDVPLVTCDKGQAANYEHAVLVIAEGE